MVLPAKVFEIKEEADLEVIADKLKRFREEELYETKEKQKTTLITEILDLRKEGDSLSGVFSKDFMRQRSYRRESVETPVTEEAPFWVKPFRKRLFLIVLGPSVARGVKKLLTNTVANKLSKVLFITPHSIVETKILHETLKELHEATPQATKLIWFDQVDIPGVEKLCLAGPDIADTTIYKDYMKHGQIWYVVFEAPKRGVVAGITRNTVITSFSKSTTQEFMNFIIEDLLKLVE
jgi:hypothetical protein